MGIRAVERAPKDRLARFSGSTSKKGATLVHPAARSHSATQVSASRAPSESAMRASRWLSGRRIRPGSASAIAKTAKTIAVAKPVTQPSSCPCVQPPRIRLANSAPPMNAAASPSGVENGADVIIPSHFHSKALAESYLSTCVNDRRSFRAATVLLASGSPPGEALLHSASSVWLPREGSQQMTGLVSGSSSHS